MKKKREFELPYRIALVVWEDSHMKADEIVDPRIFDCKDNRIFYMANVGWVIKDDEDGVVIGYCYRHDGNIENDRCIPRESIRYVEYLD